MSELAGSHAEGVIVLGTMMGLLSTFSDFNIIPPHTTEEGAFILKTGMGTYRVSLERLDHE